MKMHKAWFITVVTGKLENILSVYVTKLKNRFVFETLPSFEILSSFLMSKKIIQKALLLFILSVFTHFAERQL